MLAQIANAGAQTLKRRDNRLHIYKTEVVRVVDGDTFDVNIDLGFDVWTKKRIRLRAVNCAELKSESAAELKEAHAAKTFVEEQLPAGTVVVIQTFRVDLHGRFVADVFYLKNETDKEIVFKDGKFLNQELLNAGLAEIV
ncbi:MAG: thermonuclease family protein [Candidatus Zapsychrus exili]|nr:thermonuclease family protein [Candidatus Zapsychrus exili]